jgi:iron complex transport system permease protein
LTRARTAWFAVLLALSFAAIVVGHLRTGADGIPDVATALRWVGAALGLCDPLGGSQQAIAELRLWRALCAGLVGAGLALAGALLQGLFRNGLAEPSVLGVNAGASLGASLAILVIGGYLPSVAAGSLGALSPYLITACAFLGALVTAIVVLAVASGGGRISVPTLLLCGIAINACIGGCLAAIQSLVFEDWEVVRALMAFTFGSFDDRKPYHVAMAGTGLALGLCAVPFVATELDLFAAGEEDAFALGVGVLRTKILVLVAAALTTACAIAAAGHIAFVGLVVPHIVRLCVGPSHRRLLVLSVIGGAVFLAATDLAQRAWLGTGRLQPGILMSMVGGPFFLWLLLHDRRRLLAW